MHSGGLEKCGFDIRNLNYFSLLTQHTHSHTHIRRPSVTSESTEVGWSGRCSLSHLRFQKKRFCSRCVCVCARACATVSLSLSDSVFHVRSSNIYLIIAFPSATLCIRLQLFDLKRGKKRGTPAVNHRETSQQRPEQTATDNVIQCPCELSF